MNEIARLAAKAKGEIKTLQQRRIAAGLCPRCGAEAAPYYACPKCRAKQSVGRVLGRFVEHGFATTLGNTSGKRWLTTGRDDQFSDVARVLPSPLWGEGKGAEDKRLRPRLKGIPVDVEATLIELMREEDRGLTIEEIQAAWGKLRVKAGRESAAHDLRALILAERKRERKRGRSAAAAPAPVERSTIPE